MSSNGVQNTLELIIFVKYQNSLSVQALVCYLMFCLYDKYVCVGSYSLEEENVFELFTKS